MGRHKKALTTELIVEEDLAGVAPEPLWSPDGSRFITVRGEHIRLYDVVAKTEVDVLALDAIERAVAPKSKCERTEWRNGNVREQAIDWLPTGDGFLLTAGGDLGVWDLLSNHWNQLTATASSVRDAKISPDGQYAAFRLEHNLYTVQIASRQMHSLTDSGSSTLLNGEMDWVYPEELGLRTAYWWSPDSRHIAYLQFDTSQETEYPHSDLTQQHPKPEPQRYPFAGTRNPGVRLGIVAREGGATIWAAFEYPSEHLTARVDWLPDSSGLLVQRLNRIQDQLWLIRVEARTGRTMVLIEESDPCWINLSDDLRFVEGGKGFLWSSQRDGFRHLFLYSLDGSIRLRLTHGAWEVTSVLAVDELRQLVYFISTEASPLERHLYSVRLDGTDLIKRSGHAGWHEISISPDCRFYLDTYSDIATPRRSVVCSIDGHELATYLDPPREWLDIYRYAIPEIWTIYADDGTPLYGRLLKPPDFATDKRYPCIVLLYGGPGLQLVRNAWPSPPFFEDFGQILAQQGFVVWQLDNRGGSGRGKRFEAPLYRRFGDIELRDQQAGLDELSRQGLIDPARVGVFGWSYGGFLGIYAMGSVPGLFRAGVAGATVAHWRNYDTLYTERYLGVPDDNSSSYDESSAISYVSGLRSDLLLIHNIEDDNVLFHNAVQLCDAMIKAGKRFEQMIYTQKTHFVLGPSRTHMLDRILEFFLRTLRT
jgi:dipeptidyl-peptidase-4